MQESAYTIAALKFYISRPCATSYPSSTLDRIHRRAHVTTPGETSELPVARGRRRPSRRAPLIAAGSLLAVAALVAAYLSVRPTLRFTNTLAAPIWLTAGQERPAMLAAGETRKFAIPRGSALVVQWNLARPLSANERPMGEELRGSAVVRASGGTIDQRASTRVGDAAYFAPLITNASDQLLHVTVNAGLEGAVDCGCAIRPGARRVFIGYYRLYQNSTVLAKDSTGHSAIFRDLGPKVVSADGTAGLRFETKDLR